MSLEKVTKALGEKFSLSIKNDNTSTKVIAVLAAMFDTLAITLTEGAPNTAVLAWKDASKIVAAGFPIDAVADDGLVATNITCTALNAKKTIRQFRDYIRENPRIAIDMSVQTTNATAQFNETIEVVKYSPLIGSLNQYLSLNDFKSIDQYATDKIDIKGVNLEMAFDTLLLVPVSASSTLTLTFKFS